MKNVNKNALRKRDGEESERIFVPWFNMAEWDQVYKQLYSDDTATQVKGYERLLLWKTRCPKGIPAGAQCTMDLMQICLRDREVWPLIADGSWPQYREQELQIMYSVALLRFFNHFTPLVKSNVNESLYDLAKKLHIPDWVVNIRHETAHSHTLPSLSVLREAAHFCLDWIHEHYWKHEAELSVDLILNGKCRESTDLGLKDIVETWQAIMLYSKAGILTYKDIPDEKLKKQLLDKRSDYDTNEIRLMKRTLEAGGYIVEDNEIEEAQLIIIKELADSLEMCEDPYSDLVDILLKGEGFLASPDFLSVFNTHYDKWRLENDCLPVHFINLWKTLLDFMDQDKMVPMLLTKLIALTSEESETSHRCRVAALWIKELALSLLKVKKAGKLRQRFMNHKDLLRKVKKSFSGKFSKEKLQDMTEASQFQRMMVEKVEEDNPSLKQIMTLKITRVPHNVIQMELLEDAVSKPNKYTNIFLPCLMDLVEPRLSRDDRNKLLTLVAIYTQEQMLLNCEGAESTIYTVDNLQSSVPVEINEDIVVEDVDIEVDDPCVEKPAAPPAPRESGWIYCDGGMNWSKCPIGRLPWQDSETLMNMDFSSETVWQPVEKTVNSQKSLPGFFHEKINWDEIVRKRPRRNKALPAAVDVVDKAISIALVRAVK